MTRNEQRAAEVLHRHHENCNDAAQALNIAGLIAPDLPEPSRTNHQGKPIWETRGGTKVNTAGMLPVSLVGPFGEGWEMHPSGARDIALALLAAADYAEGNL